MRCDGFIEACACLRLEGVERKKRGVMSGSSAEPIMLVLARPTWILQVIMPLTRLYHRICFIDLKKNS